MKLLSVLAVACALVTGGCAVGMDVEAERAALLGVDRAFAQATAERGLEGFLSYVAGDASFFPAGAPIVTGKEAIGRLWSPLLTTPGVAITWEPLQANVSRAGDLGYTFGGYQLTRETEEGETTIELGSYVTIWKKEPGGAWKVVVDIGNADQPPASH